MKRALAYVTSTVAYQQHVAGQFEEAARLYREALAVDEGQPTSWYNLGLAHQSLGQIAQARDAFQRAAALDPANEQFRAALGS